MKKLILVLFLALLLMSLSACQEKISDDLVPEISEEEIENMSLEIGEIEEEKEEKKKKIDKNIVQVKIPSGLYNDETKEEFIESLMSDGLQNHDDLGSYLLYELSKDEYIAVVEKVQKDLDQMIKEIEERSDFASIEKIEHDSPYRKIKINVNRQLYEKDYDVLVTFLLGLKGSYYQALNGAENYRTQVSIVDKSSDEIIDNLVFPDDITKN